MFHRAEDLMPGRAVFDIHILVSVIATRPKGTDSFMHFIPSRTSFPSHNDLGETIHPNRERMARKTVFQ
ncbi:hypothetical protein WH50_03365 [Pokkaliibacter plantistimulans]|uniref:Uncharacterized protein n=1 Tax=Pokkaliibacter plantistimulans TaxID=1635171 RepID=A0ABX5M4I7_9GAMM|nr:hypothetical protein WH50_03365 [Pokkaliibacter plantistimulans]